MTTLYIVKITQANTGSEWYASSIGQRFYCEKARPYPDEACYFYVIRSVEAPTYIEGCYINPNDCKVIDEFEGRVIPTQTVSIERWDEE